MPHLPSLLACPPSTTLVDNFWTPDNASWLACEDLSVPGGGLTLLSARRTVHFPKSYEPYAPFPDDHYYLGLDKQTVLDAKWDMLSDHLLHSCDAPTKTTGLCEPPTVVGAGVVCLGNGASRAPIEIDGSLRTLEGDTDAEGGWLSACDEDVTYGTCAWDFVSKVDIAAATGWPAETNGIYQSSNAWGNYDGDNSLMGCNLLKTEQTYVNFVLEATVVNLDNDGVCLVFGWASIDDHYQAIMIAW